ncbi:DNA-invertase hin (plasmid) [Peribacillus frigoritolerans]
MIIGYTRVTTVDQNLDRQIILLSEYVCEKMVQEKFTGNTMDRDGLNSLLVVIRKGDTVVAKIFHD